MINVCHISSEDFLEDVKFEIKQQFKNQEQFAEKVHVSRKSLNRILNNADLDQVKEYALPKSRVNGTGLSDSKKNRIMSLLNNGYTIADVASQFGVSTSTISRVKAEKVGGE